MCKYSVGGESRVGTGATGMGVGPVRGVNLGVSVGSRTHVHGSHPCSCTGSRGVVSGRRKGPQRVRGTPSDDVGTRVPGV